MILTALFRQATTSPSCGVNGLTGLKFCTLAAAHSLAPGTYPLPHKAPTPPLVPKTGASVGLGYECCLSLEDVHCFMFDVIVHERKGETREGNENPLAPSADSLEQLAAGG
jgi:hypothetical protein